MKKLANFIYDRSKFIIAFVVLINIVSLISFYRFHLDTDFLSFFTKGNPKTEAFNQLNAKYQSGEVISVLIEDENPILDKKSLLNIFRLKNKIETIEGVALVQSLIPPEIRQGFNQITIDEQFIENNYEMLMDFIKNKYFMTDQFLSKDGHGTILLVSLRLDASTDSVIDHLRQLQNQGPLNISFAGNAVIQDTLWGYLIRILFILPPCAIILIIAVFYSVLRNRKLTIMSIIPAALAALWTFGTLFWSGQSLNLVTVLSPMFIVVIGSAYGLHYVTHFIDNMAKYTDRRELTIETMTMVGIPILLATITTMAGFISLIWTDVVPMRQMGIFVTLGIGYAGFMALFFVPAVLSRIKLSVKSINLEDCRLNKIMLKISGHRIIIPIVFSLIVIICAFFIPNLKVISDQLMFFKKSSEIRQTFAKVEKHFGGAMPLIGEIISTNGKKALSDIQFAKKVLSMERDLEKLKGIKMAFSAFDLIKGINDMATGQDAYPDNPMFLQMMLSQLSAEDLNSWISNDGIRMIVRTEGFTSDEINDLEHFVIDHDKIIRTITGMPVLFNEMNNLVVKSQVQSLSLALILIFIMLWITLRRVTAALAGLLPIAITICAIFGMLVITGFQLNIMTANLSAITIGVGVDYSIHMISGIFYYRRQGKNRKEAVQTALSAVSRPVLANAFGLAIGFSALFFSPLRIHMQAASVMWVAMVVSSMAALLLVPVFYSGINGNRHDN